MTCARLLLLLACAAVLAGCGAEERSAGTGERPPASTASAPTATVAPTTAATGTTEAPAPAPAPGPEDPATATLAPEPSQPNPGGASADGAGAGAGDEEPIRQPARFTVGAVSVTPASVTVAPFLTVELQVASVDKAVHRIKLVGTDVDFTLQPGQTETRRLPGLKAGMYTLSVDGGAMAAPLVVGDQAGP